MESRYRGDPINEPMYEAPDVDLASPAVEEVEPAPIMPSLDATWSVLGSEPGMDDMMEKGGEETL